MTYIGRRKVLRSSSEVASTLNRFQVSSALTVTLSIHSASLMSLTINSTIALRSGKQLPRLGFGVYQSTAALDSTKAALASHYIHVDSARVYRNESEVCQAVQNAGLTGKVFLTTKVSSSSNRTPPPNGADLFLRQVTSKEHGEITAGAVDESIARAAEHGQKWVSRSTAGCSAAMWGFADFTLCLRRSTGSFPPS